MNGVILLFPLYAFMMWTGRNFTFTLLFPVGSLKLDYIEQGSHDLDISLEAQSFRTKGLRASKAIGLEPSCYSIPCLLLSSKEF